MKSISTEEQIVKILAVAAKPDKAVSEVCRSHGVKREHVLRPEAQSAGLQTDDLRDLRDLEKENAQHKRLLAELDIEADAERALFRKDGLPFPNPLRPRGSWCSGV